LHADARLRSGSPLSEDILCWLHAELAGKAKLKAFVEEA
jgi:hypothetical protein